MSLAIIIVVILYLVFFKQRPTHVTVQTVSEVFPQ